MRKDISHKHQSKESWSGYSNVEINKGNSHLKWSREARRGSPHALPLQVNYGLQQEERHTLQVHTALLLQQKEDFLPCSAIQPMRNCHRPKLLLSSNGLLFKTTPLNFPLFLYTVMFLSFACWTCLQFLRQHACSKLQISAIPE